MNRAEPNVVPLCDILLVLLIIFMVASPTINAGIDIRIPEKGQVGEQSTPVVLVVEKDGTLSLNKQEFFATLDDLAPRLVDYYQLRNDKNIFVKFHEDLPYSYFVKIVDRLKGCGVEQVCNGW